MCSNLNVLPDTLGGPAQLRDGQLKLHVDGLQLPLDEIKLLLGDRLPHPVVQGHRHIQALGGEEEEGEWALGNYAGII